MSVRRLPDERRSSWTCPGCGFVHEAGHCLGCGYKAPGVPLAEAEARRLGTERGPVRWPPKPPRYGRKAGARRRASTPASIAIGGRSPLGEAPATQGGEIGPAAAAAVANGGAVGGGP